MSLIGLLVACGDDAPASPAGGAGGGSAAGAQNEGGTAGTTGTTGTAGTAGAPNAAAQALASCDAEEPCDDTWVQLVEGYAHDIDPRTACLFSALAARRPGRYRHATDSTFSNGDVGARHTLVVGGDGTVAYVREPYQTGLPPSYELPAIEPSRCTLKPASYFEACRAAVAERPDGGDFTSSGEGDAIAWSCGFGDGAASQPSHLLWFESCVSESPLRCD